MKTTSNAGTSEGLVGTVLLTDGHETGHLNLGELDLATTEGGEGLSGVSAIEENRPGHQEKHTRSATLNFCAGAAIVNVCGQTENC